MYTIAADNSRSTKTRYNALIVTAMSGGIPMVPTLFFYELGLIALGWLFLTLCWLGPHPAIGRQPIAPSQLPRRKRSTAPKVFAGLTPKPPCALCEREAAHPQPAPPAPPEPIPSPHRRPRMVDTSQHFCPHTGCRYRG